MRRILLGLGMIFISMTPTGCASPPKEPTLTTKLRGNYQKIAECTYRALDRDLPANIRMTALPAANSFQIVSEQSGVRVYEIMLTGTGPLATDVSIRSVPTIQGSDFWAKRVLPQLQSCSETGPLPG